MSEILYTNFNDRWSRHAAATVEREAEQRRKRTREAPLPNAGAMSAPNSIPGDMTLAEKLNCSPSATRRSIRRLWHLCRLLRAGGRLTQTSLAEQLGVCIKTVTRDMDLLRDLGHNLIYSDKDYTWRYAAPPPVTYL